MCSRTHVAPDGARNWVVVFYRHVAPLALQRQLTPKAFGVDRLVGSVTLRAVVRFRFWVATLVVLGVIVAGVLRAQDSDEEKRKEFLKARTDSSSTPDESPTATPKRKATKKKSAGKKKTDSSPEPKEKTSPTPKPKTTKKKSTSKKSSTSKSKTKSKKKVAGPDKTPAPKKSESAKASPSPIERPTAPLPRAIPVMSPDERAQVLVEKSGLEGDQGLAPPPSPPPRRFLFWPSNRSSSTSYRYLSRSVIEEIRRAPVQNRRWQFIVVHNSGTRQGNARVFDYYHRRVRRMQNGLAYHFVIGNGTSTGNGQVEIGDRWRRQINGGHVHSDYLNNISLGICLVGDFNRDQPTRAQLECCEELVRYLRQRCGKVAGHDILVRPHREMNPPRWATDCPGDVFPYSWFRRFR